MSLRTVTLCTLTALCVATRAWAELPGVAVVNERGGSAAAQAQPAPPAAASQTTQEKAAQPRDSSWKVEISPIFIWAPININSVTLPTFPELPPPPGGGDRPSGDTSASLNAAYMAAFRVEKSRWELNGNFVYAGMSGENARPFVKVSGDVIYGELLTGVRVVNYLYVEGGVRRVAVNVTAHVLDYPEVKRKPGVWDPVIGATYRAPLGAHWVLTLHGDGGGFGVGSEVDANARVLLDWNIARHFGLTLGYQYLYLRILDDEVSVAGVTKTLKLGTSLNGPIVGLKLLF